MKKIKKRKIVKKKKRIDVKKSKSAFFLFVKRLKKTIHVFGPDAEQVIHEKMYDIAQILTSKGIKLRVYEDKKKTGQWCPFYKGRIPYPIECQMNKRPTCKERYPICSKCDRSIEFKPWKKGEYNKIKMKVAKGKIYNF